MERLEAFERMLEDLVRQAEYEETRLKELKEQGKEKTATYKQYFGNRMFFRFMLEKYREYGLLDK